MTLASKVFAFITAVTLDILTSFAFRLTLFQTFAVSVATGFIVISLVNIYMEV